MLLRMGIPEAAAPISGLQVNVRAANWDGNVRFMLCYVIFMSFCGASIPQMNILAVHPEFYAWRLLWTERLMGCPIRLRERARRPFTHSIEDRCTLYQEPLLT